MLWQIPVYRKFAMTAHDDHGARARQAPAALYAARAELEDAPPAATSSSASAALSGR